MNRRSFIKLILATAAVAACPAILELRAKDPWTEFNDSIHFIRSVDGTWSRIPIRESFAVYRARIDTEQDEAEMREDALEAGGFEPMILPSSYREIPEYPSRQWLSLIRPTHKYGTIQSITGRKNLSYAQWDRSVTAKICQ